MNVSDTFQNMSRACVVSCRWSEGTSLKFFENFKKSDGNDSKKMLKNYQQ